MKKLFAQAGGISSTFNSTINAVTSQIKQGLDTEPTEASSSQQRQPPAINPPVNPANSEKQYLRCVPSLASESVFEALLFNEEQLCIHFVLTLSVTPMSGLSSS